MKCCHFALRGNCGPLFDLKAVIEPDIGKIKDNRSAQLPKTSILLKIRDHSSLPSTAFAKYPSKKPAQKAAPFRPLAVKMQLLFFQASFNNQNWAIRMFDHTVTHAAEEDFRHQTNTAATHHDQVVAICICLMADGRCWIPGQGHTFES